MRYFCIILKLELLLTVGESLILDYFVKKNSARSHGQMNKAILVVWTEIS